MTTIPWKKRKEKTGADRELLIGMITSDEFLRRIIPILQPEFITSPFVKKVVDWCIEYWKEYEKAPGIHIEDIYHAEAKKNLIDEDEERLIGEFLSSISEQYERSESFNCSYLLNKMEIELKKRSIKAVIAEANGLLMRGEVLAAEEALTNRKRIQLLQSDGVCPFTNTPEIINSFEHSNEPLIRFPGALGERINELLTRDSFVAFMGPEKRGKTWYLIEMSIRALTNKKNVVFFAAGDMTIPQMIMRYSTRNTGISHKMKYCGDLLIPVLDCSYNQMNSCPINCRPKNNKGDLQGEGEDILEYDDYPDWKPCTKCLKGELDDNYSGAIWHKKRERVEPLSWRKAIISGENFIKKIGKKNKLKLISDPALSFETIYSHLHLWEHYEGFIPDVIIIDYMDIMELPKTSRDYRQQTNELWRRARQLSQRKNCLVLSATQSDANSYDVENISMKNFSEDKRKLSHVTGILTLNQHPYEKRRGVIRIGQLALREDEWNIKNPITVLQCLSIGKPFIASFKKRNNSQKERRNND